jgi:hypothetical protein
MTATWITSVVIDCADPEGLAQFWSGLLHLPVQPRHSRYVVLARPDNGTPELVFQPVPEPRNGKVRIHLDVGVRDLPAAHEHALTLGATDADDLDDPGDTSLIVMRDPEGNEFCLVHRAADDPW